MARSCATVSGAQASRSESYQDPSGGPSPSTSRRNPRTSSFRALQGSSIVNSGAIPKRAPQASSGGSLQSVSGGTVQIVSGGACKPTSSEVVHAASGGAPRAAPGEPHRSIDLRVQTESRMPLGSGIMSESLFDLDGFSLPGSFPGDEILPDLSTVVTIHRSENNEEMEALSIRQKRARTPSNSSSCSSKSIANRKDDRPVKGSI